MPTCAAIGCRSGYNKDKKQESENRDRVSFHSFPKDEKLLAKWLSNISREKFNKPGKYSKLCSKHFTDSDYVTESTDQNVTKKDERESPQLQRRRLKVDAVPTIFSDDVPQRLIRDPSPERTTSRCSSSARYETDMEVHEERINAMLGSDVVHSLDDLWEKLLSPNIHVPKGFQKYRDADAPEEISLLRIRKGKGNKKVLASIVIDERLNYSLWFRDKEIRQNVWKSCKYFSALVRSEIGMRKCSCCRELLVQEGSLQTLPVSDLDGEITADVSGFLESINRGGLYVPSNLAFAIGIKCWGVFSCLQQSPALSAQFHFVSNKKSLFVEIVAGLLAEDSLVEDIAVGQLSCRKGHEFSRSLASRFFNCMCKNWAKRLTNEKDISASKINKKVPKLQSTQK